MSKESAIKQRQRRARKSTLNALRYIYGQEKEDVLPQPNCPAHFYVPKVKHFFCIVIDDINPGIKAALERLKNTSSKDTSIFIHLHKDGHKNSTQLIEI